MKNVVILFVFKIDGFFFVLANFLSPEIEYAIQIDKSIPYIFSFWLIL